jgi:hypothetical protein
MQANSAPVLGPKVGLVPPEGMRSNTNRVQCRPSLSEKNRGFFPHLSTIPRGPSAIPVLVWVGSARRKLLALLQKAARSSLPHDNHHYDLLIFLRLEL